VRILYLGELEPHARSYQRFRALQDLGHEVTGISFVRPGDLPTGKGKLIPRIFGKLGRPLDPLGVNRRLIDAVASTRFDVIWVEKGLMLRQATLQKCKALQPRVVLASYSEDDMYARHNQSAYYRMGLKYYDVVFTTKSYNCNSNELPALGARRVVFVDKAYDKATHRPISVSTEDVKAFGSDVGFIGTFEESRAAKLLLLAEAGFRVRVWGNGWDKWKGKHERLVVEVRPLYCDDYVKAICATKINLCFLRKANRDLQTDRTMEIPACGGFMLAERTPEHLRLFTEGEEVAFFDVRNDAELISKSCYYLAHDAAREQIALAARQRCLRGGYSHHDRLTFMLAECTHES
jgi:spore maturation protein CgeB